MDVINLEDVFKTSGIPTFTFVKPQEYTKLIISLRTKGRGLVIEGPSGIGKTTSIKKAIDEIGFTNNVTLVSARKADDVQLIKELPTIKNFGVVIVDDFHVLPSEVKEVLSNHMKTLADEEPINSKLILIGINKAGNSLVSYSQDLNNRIDTIRFESNPPHIIRSMLELGEKALNIELKIKEEIIDDTTGSFHIAQMLSQETCIASEITNNQSLIKKSTVSIAYVKDKVITELERVFFNFARTFASGPRLRREGRSPYLHLLNWLALSTDWSIQINDMLRTYPHLKNSVNQIVEKGYLENFLRDKDELQRVIHFDSQSNVLTIEDPKFLFYIRNIQWNKFTERIGLISGQFQNKPYDFALSFAGEDRSIAEKIYHGLVERDISVFYDKNEQHSILAEHVEDYLAPIYKSEAYYVIVLLSSDYPKKIWTKFESNQFKSRFGENKVIPIWYSKTDFSIFDESKKYGGLTFNEDNEVDTELENIAEQLAKKITDFKITMRFDNL